MLAFCPTCANLLYIENVAGRNSFRCRTCPYVYAVRGRITKKAELAKKQVDDVLGGEEAWKNVQKTNDGDVCCPSEGCGNQQAYFREVQTRSADEPATTFFKCTKCGKTWKEG